ncbi:MAG TPA: 2OG-Fe(II) oxygenase [Bacteroidia bacterium]|jgi:hypothetical protein|nr:2OG-Fe(II) oxygenase [Bacteroidia bacterium]
MALLDLFNRKKKISCMDSGIWMIDDLLNDAECDKIIGRIEERGFKVARQYDKGRHNKETFIVEKDVEEKLIAVFDKLKLVSPEKTVEIEKVSHPLEFYKYDKGDYITCHTDAPREIEKDLWSEYTLVLYLNDNYYGGETNFPVRHIKVTPRKGCGLIFDQRYDHEACEVGEGTKYILRTNCLTKGMKPGPKPEPPKGTPPPKK